jgi:hypothetical protein
VATPVLEESEAIGAKIHGVVLDRALTISVAVLTAAEAAVPEHRGQHLPAMERLEV